MVNPKTILIVEDDPESALLTRMELKDLIEPYEVVVIPDGAQALDFLLTRGKYAGRDADDTPALMILDLNLPGMGGLDLLEALQQAWGPGLRGLRVAIFSSVPVEEYASKAQNLGVEVHLQKPVTMTQTALALMRIGELLEKRPD